MTRRFLFFKPELAWPRASGHDVHTFNMMRALDGLGMSVGLVTSIPPRSEAIAGVHLDLFEVLDRLPGPSRYGDDALPLTRAQDRFRSYWGVSREAVARFGALAADFRADVVVVSGLDVLPMLGAVRGATRIWYAADEWLWHHASQVRPGDGHALEHLRAAAIKGMYERAYRSCIDRAWVVSAADARAMRWVAGIRHVDVIPNGVDTERYHVNDVVEDPNTAVFWGRLDFGPNVQALEWFCRTVWPSITESRPDARFEILGFHPIPAVHALGRIPGVNVRANVDDIRTAVKRFGVVALPFRSGGGIKNKLLEAAAMGKAIVCSPRAANGLKGHPPLAVARSAREWREAICAYWDDTAARRAAGLRQRAWVEQHHTWEASARTALEGLAAC